MGFSSISEVGNQIVTLLKRELVPDVVLHPGAVGMCSPEDHGDFSIGVYLYDIGPNNDLVDRRMITKDRRTQIYPSSFLTLRYMISAYSMGDLKFRMEEEHRILGRVIQALADYPVIGQTSSLYGEPMDTRIEMERIEAADKIRLWNFPNKPYQLSLFYRVQPVEITSTRTLLTATRVRDLKVFIRDSLGVEMSVIDSGRVLVVQCIDKESRRPITSNNVRVTMDRAKPAVVKDDGYSVFINIKEERTVVHCESRIYEPRDVEIDFNKLDNTEVFEIEMTPGPGYPRREIEPIQDLY